MIFKNLFYLLQRSLEYNLLGVLKITKITLEMIEKFRINLNVPEPSKIDYKTQGLLEKLIKMVKASKLIFLKLISKVGK